MASESEDQWAVDAAVDDPGSGREVRLCPECGMPETAWGDGDGDGYLAQDGNSYCCRGCADEVGCTCRTRSGA